MLQSEAGYIDARPLTASSAKPLATHGRTIHSGQTEKHSARADVFRFSPKNGRRFSTPPKHCADRMLWNVDRSSVSFCQISRLASAITPHRKRAKPGVQCELCTHSHRRITLVGC